MKSFIFGGDTGETPQSIARKREIAEMLAATRGTPQNVGEGLSAMGNAIAYRMMTNRANKAEATGREYGNNAFNSIIGSLMNKGGQSSGSFDPRNPFGAPSSTATVDPVEREPLDYASQRVSEAHGDPLKSGIQETAQALGMDPVDLATIISYETAGTFNPKQAGPTTQWGQHRGLIQFGEPQAQKYGVDWDNPVQSQLGPDGAVAKYFRDNGWQDGMSMLDAYSIVNAGGPGLYDRSDANNGGAPGTVRDKVEQQMGGHRQKAMAMFGDTNQPFEIDPNITGGMTYPGPARDAMFSGQTAMPQRLDTPGGEQVSPAPVQQNVQVAQADSGLGPGPFPPAPGSMQDVMSTMGNPWLTDGQRGIVNMLMQQQMERQDPAYQLDMDYKREQLNQLRNPSPKPTDDMREYDYAVSQGYGGSFTDFMTDMRKAGASSVTVGGGKYGTIPQGYMLQEDENGARLVPIPGGPEDTSQEDALKEESRAASANLVLDEIDIAKQIVQSNPATTTGIVGGIASNIDSTTAGALKNRLQTIKANIGFDKLQAMRDASPTGGALGQVSEFENRLLQSVYGSLEQAQSAQDILYNLQRLQDVYGRIINEGIPDDEARALYRQEALNRAGVEKKPATDAPEGVDPEVWGIMTPEEKALWQN